tara:strand:+ start:10108 stop:11022 length:915 start_codon:yes stop_codon:yes gene_type:complete
MFDVSKSVVQELKIDTLKSRGIRLLVKRDDLIHPVVSGNKWRKLKYNVELCKARKNKGILTFGGAFSNHLVATAATCQSLGVESIGIVRGEELNESSNQTLIDCKNLGMQLIFTTRSEYKSRNEKVFIERMSIKYPNFLIVPEGGANYHGIVGCQEILKEVDEDIDHVFVAQGTSTTSCGIAMSLKEEQQLHVVPVLKGYQSLSEMNDLFLKGGINGDDIVELLNRVKVHDQYHFGGYGKFTEGLLFFIANFFRNNRLKLDQVYTGKVMFALLDIIQSDYYDNSTVLFVHTGGLQGLRGVNLEL